MEHGALWNISNTVVAVVFTKKRLECIDPDNGESLTDDYTGVCY